MGAHNLFLGKCDTDPWQGQYEPQHSVCDEQVNSFNTFVSGMSVGIVTPSTSNNLCSSLERTKTLDCITRKLIFTST